METKLRVVTKWKSVPHWEIVSKLRDIEERQKLELPDVYFSQFPFTETMPVHNEEGTISWAEHILAWRRWANLSCTLLNRPPAYTADRCMFTYSELVTLLGGLPQSFRSTAMQWGFY